MKRVEIYTTRTCPFCIMAKRLLDQKGVAYEETDVGRDPHLRAQMTQRAKGRRTVPQIFIGDQPIGGCDELHALDHSGKLDTLLAG
ncbi:glutaredoxin 3 [uncultured Thioclava sp.]|jgi:glutaredoxin 3|uniref:Glutaredoxin n=1 Tax=Thioclava arctica TaxID=3238301 RepID=A0ABV3TJA9_9RHOB|nr:glutaredoxin 3 [uncultured Thioclava sp.]